MTISARTRNGLRRACTPSPSIADEVLDAIDLNRSGPVALTDADLTVTKAQGTWRRAPAALLTANRAITLSTTGWAAGEQIEFTRLDVEAFTLAFINGGAGAGTLYTMIASKRGYAKFQFDGTNWHLKAFGDQT